MKLFINILFFISYISISFAQYDTEFWFAVPPIVPKYSTTLYKPVFLRLMTKEKPAEIIISVPADNSFIPLKLNLTENSLANVDVTAYIDKIENRTPNQIMNKGLLIKSNSNIIAIYDLVSSPADAEFWSLKGKIGLGEYFLVPGQTSYDNNPAYTPILAKNTVIVVASQDSTDIFITPSHDAIGRPANIKFKISLNRGQTYCLESTSQFASLKLTGTIIESNKPIAVTMSDDLLSVNSCQDALGDQILPYSSLGDEYAVVPGLLNNETLQIISTEPNNEVFANDIKLKVLGRNEMYNYPLKENTYIKSKYPIYVFHITGIGCEISASTILPFTCSGIKEIYYNFDKVEYGNNNALQYLIVVPTEGIDQFYINGSQKISGTFKPFSSKSDISGGIISVNNYEYNKQLTLSNKFSTFSVGFLIGGDNVPGAKYVYLNDIQNDDRIEFKIKLPEKYLTTSDSIVKLPIYLEAKSSKFPITINDLKISLQIEGSFLKATDLNNGTLTDYQNLDNYEIQCNFPFVKLKSEETIIDTIFCKIIKYDKLAHNIIVVDNSLKGNPCNSVTSNIGVIKFSCGSSSFTFDGFYDINNITFLGTSHKNNDYIRLTNNRVNEVGVIYNKIPVSLTSSFSSTFRFRLLNGENNNCEDKSLPGADGLAFIVSNGSNTDKGIPGGGIGYDNLKNCFAIEYDTFSNDSSQIENFFDPNGNHIAVQKTDIDNFISSKHTKSNTLAINSKILPLKPDGTIYFSKIDFNITDKILKIYLDTIDNLIEPIIELNNFIFSDYIKLIDNEYAFLGFSSATGCAFENHDLLYWDFCSSKNGIFSDVWESKNNLSLNSTVGRIIDLNEISTSEVLTVDLIDIYGQKIDISFNELDKYHLIIPERISAGIYLLVIQSLNSKKIIKLLVY